MSVLQVLRLAKIRRLCCLCARGRGIAPKKCRRIHDGRGQAVGHGGLRRLLHGRDGRGTGRFGQNGRILRWGRRTGLLFALFCCRVHALHAVYAAVLRPLAPCAAGMPFPPGGRRSRFFGADMASGRFRLPVQIGKIFNNALAVAPCQPGERRLILFVGVFHLVVIEQMHEFRIVLKIGFIEQAVRLRLRGRFKQAGKQAAFLFLFLIPFVFCHGSPMFLRAQHARRA